MQILCHFVATNLFLLFLARNAYGRKFLFEMIDESSAESSSSSEASSDSPESPAAESEGHSGGQTEAIRLHNWGNNFMFCTQNIEYPRTTAEVQQIVRRAKNVRVLGTRHSFNQIADSCDTLLSTLRMNAIIAIDGSRKSVTVQPGITYTDLAPTLYSNNFALPTLAAIADITVAGATQTCAHGSGLSNANLATQVRSMRIVLANGTEASFGPGIAELSAVACGLGVFGVITEVELNLVPSFDTISFNFVGLTAKSFYEHFDEIQTMAANVVVVTSLTNGSVWDKVILTVVANSSQHQRIGNISNLFGASLSLAPNHPTEGEANQVQPWYYGLLHFRLGLSGNDGKELETEYFVPYKNGVPAIKAVSELYAQIRSVVSVFVIRTVKGDDLWLSMHNGNGPMVALHFTWADKRPIKVNHALAQIEKVLTKFGARPHWGKYFTMKPSEFLQGNYPKLNDFRKLAEKLDPTHKFRNKFINENIFESEQQSD